jgi:hypothetical protein
MSADLVGAYWFIEQYCKKCKFYDFCGKEPLSEKLGMDTTQGREMLTICILAEILRKKVE